MNKSFLWKIPLFRAYKRYVQKKKFPGSEAYWEQRYAAGKTSGCGSYGKPAVFKANFLNDFVRKHSLQRILELGCGDGNQASLFDFPLYIGLDVSPTSINVCRKKFAQKNNYAFYLYNSLCFEDRLGLFRADLTLSLDVLYHLVEKEIFEKYLQDLFTLSDRFVIIYSTDFDQQEEPVFRHECRRKFTPYVEKHFPQFQLIHIEKNPCRNEKDPENFSDCDFYVYEKKTS
jgi:SAM-dependent methyltransferase